jgi:hypothetical protein
VVLLGLAGHRQFHVAFGYTRVLYQVIQKLRSAMRPAAGWQEHTFVMAISHDPVIIDQK